MPRRPRRTIPLSRKQSPRSNGDAEHPRSTHVGEVTFECAVRFDDPYTRALTLDPSEETAEAHLRERVLVAFLELQTASAGLSPDARSVADALVRAWEREGFSWVGRVFDPDWMPVDDATVNPPRFVHWPTSHIVGKGWRLSVVIEGVDGHRPTGVWPNDGTKEEPLFRKGQSRPCVSLRDLPSARVYDAPSGRKWPVSWDAMTP